MQGLTVRDKARATRDYLLANYDYSLNPTATSVEDFVVNGRTGYCEHFATSMVLLLRAEGVHARLVSGFVATEWNNASGYLIVRAKNAHTWVEALDGDFWVRYDPTPSSFQQVSLITNILDNVRMAWYRNVVTYDLARQMQTANSLGHLPHGQWPCCRVAFESFRACRVRLVRDWRVIAGLCAAVPWQSCFCAAGPRTGAAGLLPRWRTLSENDGVPVETLLELVRRAAPSPGVEGLVWRVYDVSSPGSGRWRREKAVLRLIRDARRARVASDPQL